MAAFPSQEWCEPYDWDVALKNGTIFPSLNLVFYRAEDTACPCHSDSCGKEQARELDELGAVSFAINDLTLYLDTHPQCTKGLKLYRELLQKRLELLADHAAKYYPLTQLSAVTGAAATESENAAYGWAEGPLPWEGGLI